MQRGALLNKTIYECMNKLSVKGLGSCPLLPSFSSPRPTPEELPFVNQQVFFDKFLFASYVLVVEMEKRFPFLSKLPNETCQEISLHTHKKKKKKEKEKRNLTSLKVGGGLVVRRICFQLLYFHLISHLFW